MSGWLLLWKSTGDGAAFARLPSERRTNLKLGGQLGSAAPVYVCVCVWCWLVGSSRGNARQDKSRQIHLHNAKLADKTEKKMGKGGQEKRSSDHALCVAWVFLTSSILFSRPVRLEDVVGKRNTWRGPVSFSQNSGRLLYSYESCGTSAQIR